MGVKWKEDALEQQIVKLHLHINVFVNLPSTIYHGNNSLFLLSQGQIYFVAGRLFKLQTQQNKLKTYLCVISNIIAINQL